MLCRMRAGANKGIGYHIAHQIAVGDPSMTVLLGARDTAKGEEAAKKMSLKNVKPIVIDIDDQASIQTAADQVKKDYGHLDILCNNAGQYSRAAKHLLQSDAHA